MIPPGNTSAVVNLAVGSNALSSLHLSSIVDFKRVDDYTSTQTAMVAILAAVLFVISALIVSVQRAV